jgi:hypothetical protein
MPLDFRYHLASLAAVFGALIIGVLLGVGMREGPALNHQITELRAEYDQSKALQNIDARSDDFNAKTQGLIIHNRLSGRTVALIANPLPVADEQLDAIRATLEDAGATVSTTITLTPALQQLTPDRLLAIEKTLGSGDLSPQPDVGELMGRLGHALGVADTPVFTACKDNKLIKFTGDPTLPASAIVFIGGSADKKNYLNDLDLPFLRACGDLGVPLVATEPFDVGISTISDYQAVAPLTIDNIDHAAGRISLVLALSKNMSGHFGYKDSADATAPDMAE